jgi:hypothetical protein
VGLVERPWPYHGGDNLRLFYCFPRGRDETAQLIIYMQSKVKVQQAKEPVPLPFQSREAISSSMAFSKSLDFISKAILIL